MSPLALDKTRLEISRKIRQIRKDRRFTQAEMARLLDLSQGRLSAIEKGKGSFTAEQLLAIIRLFNLSLSYFSGAPVSIGNELQNSLAQLGASHLMENSDVLPSERLREVLTTIREVLIVADSPRQITALAPILVRHINSLNLWKLRTQFADLGLERLLGWILESTLLALHEELSHKLALSVKQQFVKAENDLDHFLNAYKWPQPEGEHVLDKDIRTSAAKQAVLAQRSEVAKRWRLMTRLRTEDFVKALRAAYELSR